MKTVKYERNQTSEIAACIKEGGLVAIMTDTVYGLAASSHDPLLYKKLIQAKERPADKPFPLMVSSIAQIEEVAELTDRDRHLVNKFMPGAVTFVFKIKKGVFPFLEDQRTLGIRIADDPWVQKIINHVGHPVWLPSANRSGLETAISSDMVIDQLEGRIEGVVAGKCEGGISSSVFDISEKEIKCYREGKLKLESILKEAQAYENSSSK